MTIEPRAHALGDLRVLDCSRLIAGGVLATVLADLGADVINRHGGGQTPTFLQFAAPHPRRVRTGRM